MELCQHCRPLPLCLHGARSLVVGAVCSTLGLLEPGNHNSGLPGEAAMEVKVNIYLASTIGNLSRSFHLSTSQRQAKAILFFNN